MGLLIHGLLFSLVIRSVVRIRVVGPCRSLVDADNSRHLPQEIRKRSPGYTEEQENRDTAKSASTTVLDGESGSRWLDRTVDGVSRLGESYG